MSRYLLQKSDEDPKLWALVDTTEQVVCQFKEGDFNGSQRVTTLNDDSDYDFSKLPSIMRAMADWLRENRPDIMFSAATKSPKAPSPVARDARRRIGQTLKAAREAKGYTTRYLGSLTGLDQGHIVRIEAGRYGLTVDTLARLCDALGLKIELK